MLKADKILDVQGVLDSAAQLQVTERTLRHMKQGQILKVIISGCKTKHGLAEFCRRLGCVVAESDEEPESILITVQETPETLREGA